NQHVFNENYSPTLVGHLNEFLDSQGFNHVSDPLYKGSALTRFGDLMIAGRMRQAPGVYGKYFNLAKDFNTVGSRAVRGAAGAGVLLSALPWLASKLQGQPTAKSASALQVDPDH